MHSTLSSGRNPHACDTLSLTEKRLLQHMTISDIFAAMTNPKG